MNSARNENKEPLISSHELCKKLRITPQQLTRFHKRGIIAAPQFRQNPNGGGKMGFFPRQILPRLTKIVKIQREGRRLSSAICIVDSEECRATACEIERVLDSLLTIKHRLEERAGG